MGTLSLEKAENLFWLGRYSERVFTTLEVFYDYYDQMLDGEPTSYLIFCSRLGIPNVYASQERFLQDYLYDKSNPDSVCSSMNRAFDNAIVLRDEIGSDTLGYIQMALDTMKRSKVYAERYLQHQQVLDYLYAFWGCVDDKVEDEDYRNLMKMGRCVERLDLYMRLGIDWKRMEKEYSKFIYRVGKVHRPYDQTKLDRLKEIFSKKEGWVENQDEALRCLNGLFVALV